MKQQDPFPNEAGLDDLSLTFHNYKVNQNSRNGIRFILMNAFISSNAYHANFS